MCAWACLVVALTFPAAAKIKAKPPAPTGSNIELSATLDDAIKAIEEVAADPILYGTYVYERDKTLTGAHPVETSSAFGKDKPPGRAFYKVVDDVIAPRFFKESEDSGTITVRYVVRQVSPTKVALRVDAVYVESARRTVHASEGAVESAEFGQVQQHLDRVQAREKEMQAVAEEDAKAEADEVARPESKRIPQPSAQISRSTPTPPLPSAEAGEATSPSAITAPAPTRTPAPIPAQAFPSPTGSADAPAAAGSVAELEQRVNRLRHQVEARVKAPGAPLKSAPFHTATTIQTVPPNAEVAVVILTPYWYGVQTTDGHTGWIQRSQLEALP